LPAATGRAAVKGAHRPRRLRRNGQIGEFLGMDNEQLNSAPVAATGSGFETGSSAEPIYVHLALTDPEVVAAVAEYPNGPQRTEFVSTCVKIGVLSLRAARGVIDGDAIRREGDRLIDQLTERLNGYRTLLESNVANSLARYFDPTSGLFSLRVENLVKDDGELAGLIQGQVSNVQQELTRTFERFIGENSQFLALLSPTESNQLLAAMRSTVNSVLQAEKAAILAQFSLDEPSSALSRLVRELTVTHGNLTEALGTRMAEVVGEFSLDREDSALSRLVRRVEEAQTSITREFSLDNAESALSRLRGEVQAQLATLAQAQQSFHTEVVGLLSSLNARRQAEARSTTHGTVFEQTVGRQLRALGGRAGDIIEDCGTTTGLIRASKVGDFVVTLPPESAAAGAKIVVEAKESSSYSLASTLAEADEARRNRGAGICLFIHSAATVPAGLEPLSKFGNDVIVVWNPEDPATDVVFQAGYLTAKALSLRAAQRSRQEAASFLKIDKAIEALRRQLAGFDEMSTTSETIKNGALKMLDRLRIMRSDIERQVQLLGEQIAAVKEGTDGSEGS
jgi:hypothetical protein